MRSSIGTAGWLGWAIGLVLVATALAPTPAHAQFDRGQVGGFVKDEQGGIVPGATRTTVKRAVARPPSVSTSRWRATGGSGEYPDFSSRA